MSEAVPGSIESSVDGFIYIEVFEHEGLERLIDYYSSGNPRRPRRDAYNIIVEGGISARPDVALANMSTISGAGALIKLPDGKVLYGLRYRGDLQAWKIKLESFCRNTGRIFAVPRGPALILRGGIPLPLPQCKVIYYASRTVARSGFDPPTETLPREPKWELAKPILQCAQELLVREREGSLEIIEIFQFDGDDGEREAHDDDLQDLLIETFSRDFAIVKSELAAQFGEPVETSNDETTGVPLCGIFRSAVWKVGDRCLYLAAAHEDRELPYLLVLGTSKFE